MLMIPSRHTDRVSSCKQWPISIRLRSYEWSALSKVQSHRSGCLPSTKTIRVHIPLRPQLYCKMSCQRMEKKLLLAHIYLKYNSDQQIHLQTLYCHCAISTINYPIQGSVNQVVSIVQPVRQIFSTFGHLQDCQFAPQREILPKQVHIYAKY